MPALARRTLKFNFGWTTLARGSLLLGICNGFLLIEMTKNGQFFSLWEIIFDFCVQASNAHILVIIALVLKAYTENCSEPELTVKL